MRLDVKSLKKDVDIENIVNILISLIETRGRLISSATWQLIEKPEHRIQLEGMLKLHVKGCAKKEADCICYTLVKDFCKWF